MVSQTFFIADGNGMGFKAHLVFGNFDPHGENDLFGLASSPDETSVKLLQGTRLAPSIFFRRNLQAIGKLRERESRTSLLGIPDLIVYSILCFCS